MSSGVQKLSKNALVLDRTDPVCKGSHERLMRIAGSRTAALKFCFIDKDNDVFPKITLEIFEWKERAISSFSLFDSNSATTCATTFAATEKNVIGLHSVQIKVMRGICPPGMVLCTKTDDPLYLCLSATAAAVNLSTASCA